MTVALGPFGPNGIIQSLKMLVMYTTNARKYYYTSNA